MGSQPLANAFIKDTDIQKPEAVYPLHLCVCRDCWLMQLETFVDPKKLYADGYLYFTSCSEPMVEHAKQAAERYMNDFCLRRDCEKGFENWVCEVASNDGYMLQWFQKEGVPCFGIEPAHEVAEAARKKGIETHEEFFTNELASGGGRFDKRGASFLSESPFDHRKIALLLANNVFAHCPDIKDFVLAIRTCLQSMGTHGRAVLEFPYGCNTIDRNEFDTIYHEHCYYFTLSPLVSMFHAHGMEIYDVEHLNVHGGAIRIFVCLHGQFPVSDRVEADLHRESLWGVSKMRYYQRFAQRVQNLRQLLRNTIRKAVADGCRIAAYGASAKSTVLMNYCGLKDCIDFICDSTPAKQGRRSPGIHAWVVPPTELQRRKPDYCLVTIWNFLDTVLHNEQEYRRNSGKFIVPIPEVKIL